MQATTQTLGKTIHRMLSAIAQAEHEVDQLMKSPDLRTLTEDFREGARMSLSEFIDIESEYETLKVKMNQLRVLAYVRDVDPSLNKPDHQGRPWTAIVRENSQYRANVPGIRAVREALGLDLKDAKIVTELYRDGIL